MDVGLFLNSQAPKGTPLSTLGEELIAQTRAAREANFDLVSAGQHYLSDYVQMQLIPLLSRLTAEAGSMKLGTGVVLLPLHHPVEIAEQAVSMASFCDDFFVGVGAGYRDVEFEAFGVPKRERASRLTEGVELMERLWTQDSVTYEGDHYAVEDVSITPRFDEKPEVWIAANAGRAVERAARIGDAWFVNPHATVSEIRKQKHEIYDPAREELGEDTAVPVFREAFVAETHEEAVETARDYLWDKYQRYIEWGQDEAMEDEDDLHKPFDELAEDRFVLGTPAEVCEQIERYEEELNADSVVLRMSWPSMPNEKTLECIELMGDEVVPNV